MPDTDTDVSYEVKVSFSAPVISQTEVAVEVRPPVREPFVRMRLSEKIGVPEANLKIDRFEVSSTRQAPGKVPAEMVRAGDVLDLEEELGGKGRANERAYVTGTERREGGLIQISTDKGDVEVAAGHQVFFVGRS